MKQFNFRTLLPHLIAVIIFLIVTIIFCKPALEQDIVLKQSDIAGWQGMSHQSFEYKEKNGHFPLWSTNMFSGMPAYQIALEGAWSPLGYIDRAFQLWLPEPLNFFFLACISFYFLCICLRIRPYAGILGALAFAYCSFSPIIVTAGHNTQMLALAYAPSVIGAIILIFEKRYIAGFALTAFFTALQIGQGHQQISYYLFLVLGAMTIAYIIRMVKANETARLMKSLSLIVVAGIIGVAVNALTLMVTYNYSAESKRGGQLIMNETAGKTRDVIKDGKTKGLTKDYAFMWSYGISETLSLMFPGVNGYGTHYAERDGEQYIFPMLNEKSHVAKYLIEKVEVPEEQAVNYALQRSTYLYWGMQPFTNGPVYLGAIVCFLFIFGMFYLDGKHKWWILAASIFAILLSWGSNLAGFNYFMFDHLPLYNKFRVPTMTLIIPQLLFPVIASLVLNKLLDNNDPESWNKFKLGTAVTAALFMLAILFYFSADFSKENKQRTSQFTQLYNPKDPSSEAKLASLNQNIRPETDNRAYEEMIMNLKGMPEAQKTAREFVSALRKDRAALLMGDILRSLLFVGLAVVFIGLYLKKKINATVLIIGITLSSLIDQLGIGSKYLNDKSFDSKQNYEASEFPMSAADRKILEDKDPNYRVFNTQSLEESKTSYYHKSIGGYHPAKLGIYDDLMTYELNGSPNVAVLNMLNAKYVIQAQGNEPVASVNPGALGNAWFVNAIKYVKGPVEEMKALNNFNPADTVIADEKFKAQVTAFSPAGSGATIKMTSFDNDAITYKSSSAANHIAVFSEVFYKDWKAYIDGKPADYFKANYVLRAMVVPAGSHTIEFKFEPSVFYTGKNISNISTWLLMLLLGGSIILTMRKKKEVQAMSKA